MIRILQRALQISASALIAAVALPAFAYNSQCPEHFFQGQAPQFGNPKLMNRAAELCYKGFAVLHSGAVRTPLASAEHLTAARLALAKTSVRTNDFHPDPMLPGADRAELRDYARSGYDRGHMAPAGDMPGQQEQSESFSLSNMVPQNPNNNRYLWEGIEAAVRSYAKHHGDIYVITGPVYSGASLKQLNGRVYVPTQIYKVVLNTRTRQAGVYLVDNVATSEYKVISVAEIETLTGLNFFPWMTPSAKQSAIALPAPTPHGSADAGMEASSGHGGSHGIATSVAKFAFRHLAH